MLITEVINLETRLRKYHDEACDGGYTMAPLHALNDGHKQQWWRNYSQPTESLWPNLRSTLYTASEGLFDVNSGKGKLSIF